MRAADDELVEVRLLGVPLDLQQRSTEHYEALKREFSLITQDSDAHEVPRRLLALAAELSDRYAPLTREPTAQREAAIERGAASVDLTYRLPASAAGRVRHLRAALAEADEYCRAGRHLLTLATEPDVARFRRWYFREFEGQLTGSPPTPWPDYRD